MVKIWIYFSFLGLVYVDLAPLSKRMIDMTYVFDETTLYNPTQRKFELHVTINETVPQGFWLQMEEITSAIHVGTHMDAPCHLGLGKWTVDKIPLEHLTAPAAVVDIEKKAEMDNDYLVTIDDLRRWEQLTWRRLHNVILVIRSGWGKRWGNRERFVGTLGNDSTQFHYPGLSAEAAQWLIDERKIYGLVSETLSLDNGQSTENWAHRILFSKNVYGVENVANVDKLPLYGATLYVMPMKIGKASGAPTRIVAMFPDIPYPFNRRNWNFPEFMRFN